MPMPYAAASLKYGMSVGLAIGVHVRRETAGASGRFAAERGAAAQCACLNARRGRSELATALRRGAPGGSRLPVPGWRP